MARSTKPTSLPPTKIVSTSICRWPISVASWSSCAGSEKSPSSKPGLPPSRPASIVAPLVAAHLEGSTGVLYLAGGGVFICTITALFLPDTRDAVVY